MTTPPAVYEQFKDKLRLRLAELIDTRAKETQELRLDRETISRQLHLLVNSKPEPGQQALPAVDQERLIEELANEIVGLGPLELLLLDPQVTEIMVNGPDQIFVERGGRLEHVPASFRDNSHLMTVIERLLGRTGMAVTGQQPCVDASLPDGTRLNIIIPPLVLNGATVTIRKKLRHWGIDDFVTVNSLTAETAEFLAACVKAKVNFIISGGTSTGKTTLVSVLSTFLPPEERVITIENVAELELLNRQHWVRLVARSPNIDGRGEIPLRVLVHNALRMRPDRIIVGECRGAGRGRLAAVAWKVHRQRREFRP